MKLKNNYFQKLKTAKKINTRTHRTPQETFEFKLTKPKEIFSFKPSIIRGLDSKWMLGLTILKVYNSIFKITEKK